MLHKQKKRYPAKEFFQSSRFPNSKLQKMEICSVLFAATKTAFYLMNRYTNQLYNSTGFSKTIRPSQTSYSYHFEAIQSQRDITCLCCRLFNPRVIPIRIYRGGSARNGDPFRLQVHEKAGMLLVLKNMKGKNILSYRFVKRPEVLSETFYGCEKVVKSFWFYYLFTFQRK